MRVGLRSKTLLIVDDNAAQLENLTEVAIAVGFTVTAVSSHKAALRAIDRQAFDAALVDKRLVEGDTENRDGLAILGHIKERNEGTSLILLTGLGQYRDAVEASEKYAARLMEKTIDLSFETKLRQVLTETVKLPPAKQHRSGVETWCGAEEPLKWEMAANNVLHPKPNIGAMLQLLDELAVTCQPILETASHRGLQKVSESALAGVVWSRGLGQAVLVAVQREPLHAIALPSGWDGPLKIDSELHRTSRKGLVATIARCLGIEPTVFTDRRQDPD